MVFVGSSWTQLLIAYRKLLNFTANSAALLIWNEGYFLFKPHGSVPVYNSGIPVLGDNGYRTTTWYLLRTIPDSFFSMRLLIRKNTIGLCYKLIEKLFFRMKWTSSTPACSLWLDEDLFWPWHLWTLPAASQQSRHRYLLVETWVPIVRYLFSVR